MKFFVDTADVAEIRSLVGTGFLDGVTTNPSLIAKSGRNIAEVIAEICALVEGPISAEAVATDFETMVKEGDKHVTFADIQASKVSSITRTPSRSQASSRPGEGGLCAQRMALYPADLSSSILRSSARS